MWTQASIQVSFFSLLNLFLISKVYSYFLLFYCLQTSLVPYCSCLLYHCLFLIYSHLFTYRNMFHETRRHTTIVYICTLVLSLVFCFVPMSDHKLKLCILVFLVMIQFFALLWYCLTYIPFARRTVKRYLRDAMGLNEIV